MNKVFVTGANGMLGSSICRKLIEQGYSVKAMCFPESDVTTILGLPLELVYGNVLNKSIITDQMKGCEYVIHVAALTNLWPRRNPFVNKVNIDGTRNVMEAVEKLSIKRLIHIGTAGSFNAGTKENPGSEKDEYTGWGIGMDYMDSKYIAQTNLLERFATHKLPVIVINPTFMIGPYDSGPTSGRMLVALAKGKLPGYSAGGKNFVYSADVAHAAVNALKMGTLGECYIAGNRNLEYKEFFELASATLDIPFRLKKIPKIFIEIAGFVSSVFARFTKKAPNISYGMAKMAGIGQYYTSQKAIVELKMPQTPVEDAIKESMKWFSENGYL